MTKMNISKYDFLADRIFWYKYSLLVLSSFISWLAVFNSGYFYLDDAFRVVTHTSINQGIQARPLADVIQWILSHGLMMDFSPFSQILCLACYAMAGIMLCVVFLGKDILERMWPWFAVFAFLVFPAHEPAIVYRIDTPGFGISMLCAITAYCFSVEKRRHGTICATILLCIVLCIYQPNFNTYLCLIFFGSAFAITQNIPWKTIADFLVRQIGIAIFAVCLYYPVTVNDKLSAAQPFVDLPDFTASTTRFRTILGQNFLENLFLNIKTLIDTFFSGLAFNVFGYYASFIIVIAVCLLILPLRKKKCSEYPKRLVGALLCLVAAFFAAFGLLLLLLKPPMEWRSFGSAIIYLFCVLLFISMRAKQLELPCFTRHCATWLLGTYLCLAVTSLGLIGNGLRDQGHFEREAVLAPMIADLTSFSKRKPLVIYGALTTNMPECPNYQAIRARFGFLNPGPSVFWGWSMVSFLPVRISIAPPPAPPENCPIVARGLYYEIRHIEANQYHIALTPEALPSDIPRYQTKYGFFLLDWLSDWLSDQ